MKLTKSERVVKTLISVYKAELRRQFLALTLQTNIHATHYDIDYALLVRRLDMKSYERIAKINARFERRYGITLDLFLYETGSLRAAINPWSAEIVRRNTKALYGKHFWSKLTYTPTQILRGAFTYLERNHEKFLRYIKNIGRQRGEWIVAWALDHLFSAVKVYNSLFGFWSLGKERNLMEFRYVRPRLARRLETIYRSRRKGAGKDPIHYLARCYALSEYISALARRRTLRSFSQSYKKELAAR